MTASVYSSETFLKKNGLFLIEVTFCSAQRHSLESIKEEVSDAAVTINKNPRVENIYHN